MTLRLAREYGPLVTTGSINGLAWDGQQVWFASSEGLEALDPDSGTTLRRHVMAADAGTAFDGRHLYQIADDRIVKLDPSTGEVISSIPAPGLGGSSGLTWAEGKLWVGQYRDRRILQIDPDTGAVLREIQSDRFVTGVSWADGELWHATMENDESELRRVDPETGAVLERHATPPDVLVSGLTHAGDAFYCGGGRSRMIRKLERT
jgi:glutamine cyclotransferase